MNKKINENNSIIKKEVQKALVNEESNFTLSNNKIKEEQEHIIRKLDKFYEQTNYWENTHQFFRSS